jgi:cytochrome subunit of sulfide dehydrogenase
MQTTLRLGRSALGLLGALALGTSPALADPPPGRLLASQCSQCHGTNGIAVSGFESLAGESASEMYNELIEMKYRSVPEGIMDLQARGYTDEQLRLISNYFAAQPRTSSGD